MSVCPSSSSSWPSIIFVREMLRDEKRKKKRMKHGARTGGQLVVLLVTSSYYLSRGDTPRLSVDGGILRLTCCR